MLPRTQKSLCDLSLAENLRAKEGGMEKTGETSSPLIFLIPTVPCVSSLVTRVSLAFRARLCAEKEELHCEGNCKKIPLTL